MEKFRILKRMYGSGSIVFIPQYLYMDNGLYKSVCGEMSQSVNSFATEKEALDKIEEYKKFERDSKIVSDEIIQIDNNSQDNEFKSQIESNLDFVYPDRKETLNKMINDLSFVQDLFNNIDKDKIELCFITALNIIKNNNKLSIQEAIKESLPVLDK